jgi:hypothetical protein
MPRHYSSTLYSLMTVQSPDPTSHIYLQEPPRPPSPEPTIAVYENFATTTTNLNPEEDSLHQHQSHHDHHDHDHDPNLSSWSTISVRLVGSHPLWGHYLYVQLRVIGDAIFEFLSLFFFFFFLSIYIGGTPRARWLASFNAIRTSI